jgi:hypothetical protein
MSSRIREMIDSLINSNAEKNPALANIIKAKLILNGINPKGLTAEAIDDPIIIAKLEKLARELRSI